MQDKIDGIQAIYQRIADAKDGIGLKTFRWTHESTVIKSENLPCVFVGNGPDNIIKYNDRHYQGYPARRLAQVYIELVTKASDDINAMYSLLRQVILSDIKVSKTGIIRELKSIGVQNYNMPDIKAITLVLGLNYIDSGT